MLVSVTSRVSVLPFGFNISIEDRLDFMVVVESVTSLHAAF